MIHVAGLLRHLSVAGLGVFAGAMLTEGLVLVPYWRSLSAAPFFAWYRANDARLLGFFGPLTAIAALVTLAAAGTSWFLGHPGRGWALVAAIAVSICVTMFPLHFREANARFAAAAVPEDELPAVLGRWAAWHRVRVALSFVALAAGLLAL